MTQVNTRYIRWWNTVMSAVVALRLYCLKAYVHSTSGQYAVDGVARVPKAECLLEVLTNKLG